MLIHMVDPYTGERDRRGRSNRLIGILKVMQKRIRATAYNRPDHPQLFNNLLAQCRLGSCQRNQIGQPVLRILENLDHLVVTEPIYWRNLQDAMKAPPVEGRLSDSDDSVLWYGIDRTNRQKVVAGEDASFKLKDAGANIRVITYPDAKHSFTNPDAAKAGIDALAYDADADRRSWEASMKMFEEAFKLGTAGGGRVTAPSRSTPRH